MYNGKLYILTHKTSLLKKFKNPNPLIGGFFKVPSKYKIARNETFERYDQYLNMHVFFMRYSIQNSVQNDVYQQNNIIFIAI